MDAQDVTYRRRAAMATARVGPNWQSTSVGSTNENAVAAPIVVA